MSVSWSGKCNNLVDQFRIGAFEIVTCFVKCSTDLTAVESVVGDDNID